MAKKRANGDGSIRKRKDGRWEGRYVVGQDPITGKMISRNVLGKTQAQVKEKLRTAIENSKRMDYTQTGKYTVGQWMDEWLEAYAKVKVRPSSHQTYKGYIENHIKPNIGDIPIEKLTSLQLQKFYRLLLTEGRIPRIESEKQPRGLSAIPLQRWHCKTVWTSRPSPACWATSPPASLWTPTPTSPPAHRKKPPGLWGMSWRETDGITTKENAVHFQTAFSFCST